MNFTGERLITDFSLGKGVIEHLHRYAITLDIIKGKSVLDIACGEGYGTNLMADYASKIYGVDISSQVIDHAGRKYKKSNLVFLEGIATVIPIESKSIDVVVSFETLEHLDLHDEMLSEINRVLMPGGILVISTPERDNYRKVDPDNHFHVKELTGDQFMDLLSRHFKSIQMFRQYYTHASFISPSASAICNGITEYLGDFNKVEVKDFEKNNIYNIAFCSNGQLPSGLKHSFFNGEENIRLFYNTIWENNQKEYAKKLYNTISYKVGNLLIKPFAYIKKVLKKGH